TAAWLVGLLGVLRAGGCYVPLDPAYPEERVAYMLDSGLAGRPAWRAPRRRLLRPAGPGLSGGAGGL
ncbi:AMP-binding protein, partial [Pseudomonas aeruginosa]